MALFPIGRFSKMPLKRCSAKRTSQNSGRIVPADLILVAGGDDALWPSGYFARQILQSRQAHGRQATLIFDKDAGHRILLPGETTQRSKLHAHGGSDEADAKLGQNAWRAIRNCCEGVSRQCTRPSKGQCVFIERGELRDFPESAVGKLPQQPHPVQIRQSILLAKGQARNTTQASKRPQMPGIMLR